MRTYEEWQIIQQLLSDYLRDHPDITVIPYEEVSRIYLIAHEQVHGKSATK